MIEFGWNSLDTELVVFEGVSDPNPDPVPESVLKRREELREFYRQRDAAIKANLANSADDSSREQV